MAATKQLSEFLPLQELNGVYVARKTGLRCTAVTLNDGSICLWSPVAGLGEDALSSLAAIGDVSLLLAPNHYHNKALQEYASAFPHAKLCASAAATPRLEKVTGLKVQSLSHFEKRLPDGLSILQPEGLKTGEIWLQADHTRRRSWFVVDALCGPRMTAQNDRSDQPALLKTFPTFGVGNRDDYIAWFKRQLAADKPELLVPCHGAIVAAPNLPAKIGAVMAEAFD